MSTNGDTLKRGHKKLLTTVYNVLDILPHLLPLPLCIYEMRSSATTLAHYNKTAARIPLPPPNFPSAARDHFLHPCIIKSIFTMSIVAENIQ